MSRPAGTPWPTGREFHCHGIARRFGEGMATVAATPELLRYIRDQGIDIETGKPVDVGRPDPINDDISEKEFEAAVNTLAAASGWLNYHTLNSRGSEKGFPDRIFLRQHRMIVAELKTNKGKLTPAQKKWINAFRMIAGVEVFVWRPAIWSEIQATLK
jgi:hypothetical protein